MGDVSAPQGDLFSLHSPLYGDVQGERTVAEFLFSSCIQENAHDADGFESGEARIEINPSKTVIATIYDNEILLYIPCSGPVIGGDAAADKSCLLIVAKFFTFLGRVLLYLFYLLCLVSGSRIVGFRFVIRGQF